MHLCAFFDSLCPACEMDKTDVHWKCATLQICALVYNLILQNTAVNILVEQKPSLLLRLYLKHFRKGKWKENRGKQPAPWPNHVVSPIHTYKNSNDRLHMHVTNHSNMAKEQTEEWKTSSVFMQKHWSQYKTDITLANKQLQLLTRHRFSQ